MKTWESVTLADVTIDGSEGLRRGPFGGAIKKEIFVSEGYKVYEQKHAIYGDFDAGEYFIGDYHYRKLSSFAVHPGDMLVSCSGTLGRVSIVPDTAKPGIINQALLRIRPNQELVHVPFLKMLLESPDIHSKLFGSAGGSAIKNVRPLAAIRKVTFLLPPLSEQKRIAEILDRAEALRAKRRVALALLDELTQSIFLDMFGDPITNPKGWNQATVAQICGQSADNCVGGPFGSDLTQADYVESPGVPVIRGQNLATDEPFIFEEGYVFVSDAKARKLSRNTAIRGDVLISQRGARLAGQVALIPPDSQYENYIVSQSQMRIRPDTNLVDPLYLVYYFRSSQAIRRMESLTISTGVPHINLGILRDFAIEVPEINLQREFVSRAGEIGRLKAIAKQGLAKLNSLFAAVQTRAFRGEI